jgi:hypothetical protein
MYLGVYDNLIPDAIGLTPSPSTLNSLMDQSISNSSSSSINNSSNSNIGKSI